MATGSESIELTCDCPSYSIVKASRLIGLQHPEDVRWCRSSHHGRVRPSLRCFLRHPWKVLRLMCAGDKAGCHCGRNLPLLEEYLFQLASGRQVRYRLGQCFRCRTVYWEDA
jgi:hypothetical protein